ncbi:MAG: hypothetical protein ICV54_09985 [Nostoc sp. C3-bin3]|nr:hypothetical protein [Nostoc sp. C3-bin3]
MIDIHTTFEIPDWIKQGLKAGEYIRVGGVIREAKTKQIVAMLREITPDISQSFSLLTQVSSVAGILNLGVSILNIGVSVIGFTLMRKHLKAIEQQINTQLSQVQDNINNLHRKFDISVYANFNAALDLAIDASMTVHPENRRNMATFAVNRFLEAQHIFNDYVNLSFENDINFTDKYILSLSLTYVARSRCYLELEEIKLAISCLNDGAKILRSHVDKYVKTLLISQPIAKITPNTVGYNFVILGVGTSLESTVELHRLAHICKWLEPEFNSDLDDQSILFKSQEKNLVKFHLEGINAGICGLAQARHNIVTPPVAAVVAVATTLAFPILTIPLAVGMATGVTIQAIQDCFKDEDTNSATEELAEEQPDTHTKEQINANNLLKVIENVEQIIETYNRFEAYLIELQVMQQLGMSFQNWLQLTPHIKAQQYEAESIYIIPSQPLKLN